MYPGIADSVIFCKAWDHVHWHGLTGVDKDPTISNPDPSLVDYGSVVRNCESLSAVAAISRKGSTVGPNILAASKRWQQKEWPNIARKCTLNSTIDRYMFDKGIDMPSATRSMAISKEYISRKVLLTPFATDLASVLFGASAWHSSLPVLRPTVQQLVAVLMYHAWNRQKARYQRAEREWDTTLATTEVAFQGKFQ